MIYNLWASAGMADRADLKSAEVTPREGSTPSSPIKLIKIQLIGNGRLAQWWSIRSRLVRQMGAWRSWLARRIDIAKVSRSSRLAPKKCLTGWMRKVIGSIPIPPKFAAVAQW